MENILFKMADKAWHTFKDQMKKKRAKRGKGKEDIVKKTNELVIQRLSDAVSGKAQKYLRVVPTVFVPFDSEEEVTLKGIKNVCETYFRPTLPAGLTCDVLVGEQGPSCKTVQQIPNMKLIHIRFITENEYQDIGSSSEEDERAPDEGAERKKARVAIEGNPMLNKMHENLAGKSERYPKRLSVLDMIKLGKVVNKHSTTAITLHSFNIDVMAWSKLPTTMEFALLQNPLGTGGFRQAFKATTNNTTYSKTAWVVKKYLPETVKIVEETHQTVEAHTRKVVQMHMLARNFALQLEKKSKRFSIVW